MLEQPHQPEPGARRASGRPHRRGALDRRAFLRTTALAALAYPSLAEVLAACGSPSRTASSSTPLAIASPSGPVLRPITQDNPPIADGLSPEQGAVLELYNYADYIDPAALKSFEQKYAQYKVKVRVSTFNTQDEALAKLRSGKVAFDIYFPGYDLIGKLVQAGLVRPLTHSYIPNISQVWPQFTDPFYDKEWRYTVPYTVYTTGIGWRSDKVTADIGGMPNPYDAFWDAQYASKLSILDDYRDGICLALLRNGGTNVNTGDAAELDKAKAALLQLTQTTHPKVDITDYTDLPAGQVNLVQAWSGDMVNAVSYLPSGADPKILQYWFPADGKGMVDNDLMVILRGGKSPVLAHLFLNHMLDYDTAMGNFQAIGYQPPQTRITPSTLVSGGVLPASLSAATVLPEYFDKGYRTLELPVDVDARWQAIWEQFKAGA